ncbi:unnamed protein product [Sphagnum tenellum]
MNYLMEVLDCLPLEDGAQEAEEEGDMDLSLVLLDPPSQVAAVTTLLVDSLQGSNIRVVSKRCTGSGVYTLLLGSRQHASGGCTIGDPVASFFPGPATTGACIGSRPIEASKHCELYVPSIHGLLATSGYRVPGRDLAEDFFHCNIPVVSVGMTFPLIYVLTFNNKVRHGFIPAKKVDESSVNMNYQMEEESAADSDAVSTISSLLGDDNSTTASLNGRKASSMLISSKVESWTYDLQTIPISAILAEDKVAPVLNTEGHTHSLLVSIEEVLYCAYFVTISSIRELP